MTVTIFNTNDDNNNNKCIIRTCIDISNKNYIPKPVRRNSKSGKKNYHCVISTCMLAIKLTEYFYYHRCIISIYVNISKKKLTLSSYHHNCIISTCININNEAYTVFLL